MKKIMVVLGVMLMASTTLAELVCSGQLTRDDYYQSSEISIKQDTNVGFNSESGQEKFDNLEYSVFYNKTQKLIYLSVSKVNETVVLSTTLRNPQLGQNLELVAYNNGQINLSCKLLK